MKFSDICKCIGIPALIIFFTSSTCYSQQTSGLDKSIIVEKAASADDFPVADNKTAIAIRYDVADHKGVIRAINDLQNDIFSVTGQKPQLLTSDAGKDYEIVIGTLGNSKLIDHLAKSKKLDVKDLNGKWESFVITTIKSAKQGEKPTLVIAGSDKRGTIYGIYELSKQLGVSPWYWWQMSLLKKEEQRM